MMVHSQQSGIKTTQSGHFLNGKTSKEIQEMIEDIMKNEARRR